MGLWNKLLAKKTTANILAQLAEEEKTEGNSMKKVLSVRDLTALGIAAVIGAGIFSTVGKACFDGGPGVIFLFLITAVVCAFSALCYAEFAARIPISGSAYTYSYASFGEFVAWIIGWDLLMEYAIGNIVVAISWSSNLNSLLNNMGLHLPGFLSNSMLGVKSSNDKFMELTASHGTITPDLIDAHQLWTSAPHLGPVPLILNIPALLITIFITWLVFIGIQESRTGSNLMVAFKLIVILAVIAIGFFYVNPKNWSPFLPNGMGGVMKGVSAVFFAYIGFDAISTTAEECKNPQRDLPRGMIYSLIICTVLYVLIALVLTGMNSYKDLNNEAFLANSFNERGLNWLGGIIALSALIATTSVLLVFQLGQPRIWMSMSRDGLLPPAFKKLHPKYKTPSFSTIVTGLLVGIPCLFLDSDFVTDLTSIGTLFAFVLVCGGILLLPREEKVKGKFRVPYVSGRYWVGLLMIVVAGFALYFNSDKCYDFVHSRSLKAPDELVSSLTPDQFDQFFQYWDNVKVEKHSPPTYITQETKEGRIKELSQTNDSTYYSNIKRSRYIESLAYNTGWSVFVDNITFWVFILLSIIMTIASFIKKLSLIPVMGLLSCFYLITELGLTNWMRFIVWLIIGLIIYFTYGIKHSRLRALNS